ncbi:MAG TPA: hydantoinase/oxoprolinase family protein [Nitrososphaerales archaeon]|nr:hydantoinase/oxoprolinase family protein [Nitrososphaerales archaeon]
MFRLSVDVGGTFTDAVMVDDSGKLYALKIESTPRNPELGFVDAVVEVISGRVDPERIESLVHVGTIGSNLLLGQLGIHLPACALVTTKGFRDVIEIGRQNRPELYNINFSRPRTLVPRSLRFEMDERVDSDGGVLVKVSKTQLRELARRLRNSGAETVAICFLNSYVNGSNERVAETLLKRALHRPVYASSEVDPEQREYERASTTVVNAVLAPAVSGYLRSAGEEMRRIGIKSELYVLGSSGGLLDIAEVGRRPILAVESGPAAGVVAASEVARSLRLAKVISFDMGGTTAKAGAILNFEPAVVPEVEVGGRVNRGRLVKGSGYPVRTQSIDLAEVSAGGGTVVSVGEAGEMAVGPMSAGADPGPACYGKGGEAPTITDANLILGRIGTTLLGGKMRLNPEEAARAFERLRKRSGMGAEELAAASLRIVNFQMAKAIEIVTLERGLDARDFALVAFGGAGPMHAVEVAELIGITKVIVPPLPGLFSALGMLMTDMRYDRVRGMVGLLEEVGEGKIEETFEEMERESSESLNEKGIEGRPSYRRSIDLRYYGQGYELEIVVRRPFNRAAVTKAFEGRHVEVYGFAHEGERIELTALRLTTTIPATSKVRLSEVEGEMPVAREGRRRAKFGERWFETRVYSRELLPVGGEVIRGPAIVEEYDSTVVVPPGWGCVKNRLRCLVIERV